MVFRWTKRKKIYNEKKAKQNNNLPDQIGEIETHQKPLGNPNASLVFYEHDENGDAVEKNCPAYILPEGIAYDPNRCTTKKLKIKTIDQAPEEKEDNDNEVCDET